MKKILAVILMTFLVVPGIQAQAVNDQDIIDRVTRAIENNAELTGAEISIFSVNGYVLLAGQVLNPQQRQAVSVTAAFAARDIRRLINELEVVDALDNSFNDSDMAILNQIVEVIPEMSPETLPVIHNGVVHLLGQVTREEGNEVATTISKMSGVKNIRVSFEFIDWPIALE